VSHAAMQNSTRVLRADPRNRPSGIGRDVLAGPGGSADEQKMMRVLARTVSEFAIGMVALAGR